MYDIGALMRERAAGRAAVRKLKTGLDQTARSLAQIVGPAPIDGNTRVGPRALLTEQARQLLEHHANSTAELAGLQGNIYRADEAIKCCSEALARRATLETKCATLETDLLRVSAEEAAGRRMILILIAVAAGILLVGLLAWRVFG